ncbi:hypothetical protein SAMN03159304_01132 [Pseudomonas sp. NFACC24-1]|uniref:hypothetical protein n=1 Tax=Pseudomonas sp. NFACC24-1 TaxID=1566189 RepID=UPI0008E0EFEA|nr:hypothetical protein [Pseudomonas sp. NFACC24-1]SFN83593.1 hypothetical protein SAMN03159304_01132 [Pseudomonas sp. NFACC24-1]
MQSLMQQRAAGLQALRTRAVIATAEFYSMIGKEAPAQQIRYHVVTKGNAYHIVERSTGLTKGFRWTWKASINFAQVLEARMDIDSFDGTAIAINSLTTST